MTAWIRRHQIVSFFVLTYIISWSIFIGIGIIGQRPESPVIILAVYGPTLAAIILTTLMERGTGVKKLLEKWTLWRVGIH